MGAKTSHSLVLEPVTRAGSTKSVYHVTFLGNNDPLRNPQCAVREVSACSGLADINAPHGRGCAPIQPSTARLGR